MKYVKETLRKPGLLIILLINYKFMPYRKEQLINGEIYHVVARRIENLLLFKNTDDYYRGIFGIYEFNTTAPVEIWKRRKVRTKFKKALAKGDPVSFVDSRNKLVEVLSFCLMPNHIHLLLRQLKEGGITTFMNKYGAGYPAYFKRKYRIKNKGYFFQGRFVSVHIKTDDQLKTVFAYIHTNPVSLIEPKWKEKGIKNPRKAIKFLENYKWSSYLDYIGKQNFPSVTDREFLLKTIGGKKRVKKLVEDWIKYKKTVTVKKHPELFLE